MTKLRELHEKNGILFAVLWIVLYCAIMTPVIGKHGEDSPVMMLALLIVAGLIFGFIKANRLEAETGLDGWPKDTRRYLYFIPMWILATGNLWGGVSLNYKGTGQVIAILSMLLVGFIEEMIFRGFLFRALLKTNSVLSAVIISAATFGMGHLVNLLSGQVRLYDGLLQEREAASVHHSAQSDRCFFDGRGRQSYGGHDLRMDDYNSVGSLLHISVETAGKRF